MNAAPGAATQPPAELPLVEPGMPADWHVTMDVCGQPYPTRNHAPDADGDSDACLNLTATQLNYLRAIHEAGHAVTALLANAHLHSAEIVLGDAVDESGGVVNACNLADGHGYAIFSAAGERASDRWLREAGLWTPERAVAVEVGARGDRRSFLAINPHVGFGDRQVHYQYVHDLADQALDTHWAAVTRVADQLAHRQHLDGATIAALTGLPNGKPGGDCPHQAPADWWEETPAQAARYDRYWYDRDED